MHCRAKPVGWIVRSFRGNQSHQSPGRRRPRTGSRPETTSALWRLQAKRLFACCGGRLRTLATGAWAAPGITAGSARRLRCKRHSSKAPGNCRDPAINRRRQVAYGPPQTGQHDGGNCQIGDDAAERHVNALAMRKVMNEAPYASANR